MSRTNHPKADVDQLDVARCGGRWGMIQIKMTFKITTIGLHKYLSTTNDWMLQLVLRHEARKKAQSISKQSNQFRQEHDTQDETNQTASSTI